MTLSSLGGLLRGERPLGQLAWWTGGVPAAAAQVKEKWAQAGLPPVTEGLPAALEQTMRALPGTPVLERSGVFWLPPELEARVAALGEVLTSFRGWELHTLPVRATQDTLEALRSSAGRWRELSLAALSHELEGLLSHPRQRASLLVRQLDTLEALRRQAGYHQRHLSLGDEGLAARLDGWAARIDAALCARIVA